MNAESTAITIATPAELGSRLPERLAEIAEEAERLDEAALAPSTRRAYRYWWGVFSSWAEEMGVQALPAAPETAAAFVTDLSAQGKSVSTITKALSAITNAHSEAGYLWTASAPAIKRKMRGIRRTKGTMVNKKAPITESELWALTSACDADTLKGLRDRALLLIGFFGAFRRSELVALELRDVVIEPEGLRITLRRSKTDQIGEGMLKALPRTRAASVCPVKALEAYLAAAELELKGEGKLFRSVNRHGGLGKSMSGRAVANVVKAKAEMVGLNVSDFSGHSLRSGFVTTAARKGKTLHQIMAQTGHKSEKVALGYIRRGRIFEDNAAAGLM